MRESQSMNIVAITRASEIQIPVGNPLVLAVDPADLGGLVPVKDSAQADIALVRTDERHVAIVGLHSSATLTINGERIPGGLYFAATDAIVHVARSRGCRFGILFDDSVREVPSGATCDVCGKVLIEPGKRHCRHICCKACLDVFGENCPDCGRNLSADMESSAGLEALRDYL
jgi:hypothetical protein